MENTNNNYRKTRSFKNSVSTQRITDAESSRFPTVIVMGIVCFVSLAGWGVAMLVGSSPDRVAPVVVEDVIESQARSAAEVASTFVQETDAKKRLSYVSDPLAVRDRMQDYPEQARGHAVEELKPIGYSELNGRAVSSFSARFADGSYRMLSVIETDDGPKVDWDSYARHCTASWEDLFLEKEQSAEVRVFVQPGDYHVGQFRDKNQWVCFSLKTPDCDRSIYAYAEAGSEMAKRMQRSVLGNASLRQHMTLKISSQNGSGKDRLFIVDELLAMGWVVAALP